MAGDGKQDPRTAGQSIPAGAEVKQEAVRIPEDTAATEPDTERQELITAVNRSCWRRENAVSCIRRRQVSLKPFLEEQNAASEARSAQDGAEAGQQPPEAEAHVRRREGNSPLRQDKAPVRLRQEQTGCLPEFRRRFRRKKDVAV